MTLLPSILTALVFARVLPFLCSGATVSGQGAVTGIAFPAFDGGCYNYRFLSYLRSGKHDPVVPTWWG